MQPSVVPFCYLEELNRLQNVYLPNSDLICMNYSKCNLNAYKHQFLITSYHQYLDFEVYSFLRWWYRQFLFLHGNTGLNVIQQLGNLETFVSHEEDIQSKIRKADLLHPNGPRNVPSDFYRACIPLNIRTPLTQQQQLALAEKRQADTQYEPYHP